MALDTSKVLVGLADQSVTGAISTGDVITSAPADFAAAQAAITGFADSGYVSTDGISITTDNGTKSIQEWNLSKVRTLLEDWTGSIAFTLIQADYAGWCQLLGSENVTKIAATAEHGEYLHIKVGAHLPEPKAWAMKMKDGDERIIVLVPNGQVTSGLDLKFQASEAIALPITIDCLDDGSGEGIHIYTDDGKVSGSTGATGVTGITGA